MAAGERAKRLQPVKRHLTREEVVAGLHRAVDGRSAVRWSAVLHAYDGMSAAESAALLGHREDWARRLIRAWNQDGVQALIDGRKRNRRKRLLDDEQLGRLREAILNEVPPGGGLWTGPKVVSWVESNLGVRLGSSAVYDYLQRMKLSKQLPRPRNVKADADRQEAFKKKTLPTSSSK